MSAKSQIEVSMLTPVHVGAGQEKKLIKNLDFIYRDKKLILIDTTKIFQSLDEKERAIFLNHLAKSTLENFGTYLTGTRKIDLDSFKIAEIDCPGGEPGNEVLSLVSAAGENGRRVYLPGSSIKGAIRSVLFAYFYNQKKIRDEREIFGSIDRNLMSFLQVSDALFNNSRVVNCKIFNLYNDGAEWLAGWKHGRNKTNENFSFKDFVTYYEVFGLKEKSTFSIKINKEKIDYLNRGQEAKKYIPPNLDLFDKHGINRLFEIINWHSRRYLEAELKFFRHYANGTPFIENIIESIESLVRKVPNDNQGCVLHLACGSGFHGITGDWQFSGNHVKTGYQYKSGAIKYKSRKMVFRKLKGQSDLDFMPMGFVKLAVKQN